MILCENANRKIIPIASGKGGVGKSVMTANLGIRLGNAGYRTILVDLDMGGSNLHSVLGLKNTSPGLGNFVSNKDVGFKDILLRTEYPNLFFVPGDVLVPGTADLAYGRKKSIISQLLKMETDYILLDLGSGSHNNVVDFFLISNAGVLVATPQVTSILNVYSFIQNTVFRFLHGAFTGKKKVADYMKNLLKETKPNSLPPIGKILPEITKIDKEAGAKARDYIKMLKPNIILNMADDPDDLQMIESLRDLIKKNLTVDIGCLGCVYNDKAVGRSLNLLKPLVILSPESLAARQIGRMAEKIIQSRGYPDMPLDLTAYKDSFGLARIEADQDFLEIQPPAKSTDPNNLGPEEFLEVLTAQQKKISELQGTIRMLTLKNPSGL